LAFSKPDFEILFFLEIKKQTKSGFFQAEKLGSGKILSELRIYYKSLLTRVSDHARCTEYCKDFTVALKVIDVITVTGNKCTTV